jgi:2-methylisocitrate lyase-like PEP mutase family enzyme
MPNALPMLFAALHHGAGAFVLPNAWDVASAVLLADAGFPAIGTTSLGVTAAAGLPDGAAAGAELTIALARTLVQRLAVPVTVDVEGGYSDDPASVAALVAELAGFGVAGVNLEDGRPDGSLRPVAEHTAIVGAVVEAAPSVFVNARTDTYWLRVGPQDGRLGETTRRLAAYRDAGASGVFVPGLSDLAQTAIVAGAVALPLNVLWAPGADLAALAAAGVVRVSTGSGLYRHALGAAIAAAQAARTGTPPATAPVDYHDLQHLLRASAR